jgi:hypothetical protein
MQGSTLPLTTKQALQTVTVGAGILTSRWRMTPDFLICGAQRSGTTSMYRALAQHGSILKPVLHKGVHYFDTGYQHSGRWYRAHFPSTVRALRRGRRIGEWPLTFESSPYYLCHPLAPARIVTDLPDVRIIVLLRDPVERAYSAHAHELGRGFETEDFPTALQLEESRLAGQEERLSADGRYHSHSHQHHAYRARGQYVQYLRRWEDLIGKDRIHVVDSQLFFTEPEQTFGSVERFLGLPHDGAVQFEQHNARPRRPLIDDVRRELQDHFRPWDEDLCDWLGARPSWVR